MTPATKAGGAVLPVVAKVGDLIITVREQVMVDFGSVNQEWLVLKSDAQATIDELRAEVERLTRERDQWRNEYRFMQSQEAKAARELESLKAKQIDVEAVMRLADGYADAARWNLVNGEKPVHAAREALRASLLGDGGTTAMASQEKPHD